MKIFVKEKQELEEAVEYMAKLIQEDATIFKPAIKHQVPELHNILLHIKELVCEKCRARCRSQNSSNPLNKTSKQINPQFTNSHQTEKKIKHSIIKSQNFLQTTIQY
jgi:hypothetical protein